jgi:hypothetical protein
MTTVKLKKTVKLENNSKAGQQEKIWRTVVKLQNNSKAGEQRNAGEQQ